MKKSVFFTFILASVGLMACGQKPRIKQTSSASSNNSLLWRITGKNLSKPSYLFGTMHMLCGDDIVISDSLKAAIEKSDNVYLELDMNNLFEMFGAMGSISMKGDTSLADLLTEKEYEKVKNYFDESGGMIPFDMLKTMKPMLAASLISQQELKGTTCDNVIAMETLIMQEAKEADVEIKGLETMKYQLGIFDKIPYQLQAKQLYEMISKMNDTTSGSNEMAVLTEAYRSQKLEKLEEMMNKDDMGIKNFTELLLYNRNENWAKKLQTLMTNKSLVVAVGAGHLPGKRGVINLLRQAGYKVEPVKNEMVKRKTKEV